MRKKDIREIGITVILVFVLIILTVNTLKLRKRAGISKKPAVNIPAAVSQAPVIPDAPAAPRAPVASVDDPFEAMDKEAGKYTLKKDPFSAAAKTTMDAREGFSLTGIIWDKDNPMAIINGEVVKAGDAIGDNKVVAVNKDRVTLRGEKGDTELILQ